MGDEDGRPAETGSTDANSWSNGLLAASYVPLTDVSKPMAPRLLSALERARIAAYLAETDARPDALRLYVASGERADARTIVASVVRASGESGAVSDEVPETAPAADPLAGIDADAAFAALIADWHVDTHVAIRDAERDLTREDEDWRQRLRAAETAAASTDAESADSADELTWLDDDHYVPPNPPPIPRPTAAFLGGFVLILASIVVLAFGDMLALTFEIRLFLAVAGILSATGIFVMRLRTYRDDEDDGAVV